MHNLVVITSIINTPNNPLSYTENRSVYSREERYIQTQNTIVSIKKHIPDCAILLVECSEFNPDENSSFQNNCTYVLNLWDQKHLHNSIFGASKS